jgi:uncharacterized cupredoxin-like copper-binding protein
MKRRVAALALLALSLAACAPGEGAEPRTVTLTIRYSRFQPGHLSIAEGTTVRFVVDNRDPIAHELIVGDQEVQDLHETGTGHHHGAVPGEISAPAGSTVETTYTFDQPGEILFGCHLPGHYTYGMRGTIRVV